MDTPKKWVIIWQVNGNIHPAACLKCFCYDVYGQYKEHSRERWRHNGCKLCEIWQITIQWNKIELFLVF